MGHVLDIMPPGAEELPGAVVVLHLGALVGADVEPRCLVDPQPVVLTRLDGVVQPVVTDEGERADGARVVVQAAGRSPGGLREAYDRQDGDGRADEHHAGLAGDAMHRISPLIDEQVRPYKSRP